MFYLFLVFNLLFHFECSSSYVTINADEESDNKTDEISLTSDLERFVGDEGYNLEKHQVVTEDDYILELQHLTPTSRIRSTSLPPVLMMPGILASSADYLNTGRNRSLAMRLADQGYDVWLGNNRGTTFSRKHKKLDPNKDAEYWDFSFHELGLLDDTALIDYVLSKTAAPKLSYVAHSQGSTQFFALAATKPEYNKKVVVVVAMAPPIYMSHLANPIFRSLKYFTVWIEWLQKKLNVHEILPHNDLLTFGLKLVCRDGSKFQWICELVMSVLAGFNIHELDTSMLPKLLESIPAGSSVKELKHYLQEIKSGHFRPYDYGVVRNLELYGEPAPPDYNLSNIVCPVALLYSTNDWLSSAKDVEKVAKQLPNLVESYQIKDDLFTHADYMYAKDNDRLVNFEVINILNKYNGKSAITSTTASPTSLPTSTKRPSSGERTTPGDRYPPSTSTTSKPVKPSSASAVGGTGWIGAVLLCFMFILR